LRGRGGRTGLRAFLLLVPLGGVIALWRKGSRAVEVRPPSSALLTFQQRMERVVRPFVVSKQVEVAASNDGRAVQVWWWLSLREDASLGRLMARLREEAQEVGVKVLAVSRLKARNEASIFLIPSRRERLVVVLRRAPVRRGAQASVIIEPPLKDNASLLSLAGLHFPVTFCVDAREPSSVEVAKWLFAQGYEVVARNFSDIALLPECFTGVLVDGRPSPRAVEEARRRDLFLVLPPGARPKGGRAITLDLVIEGSEVGVRQGLKRLFSMARRRGKAVGLVRLRREGVPEFVKILRGSTSEGVEIVSAGRVAKKSCPEREIGRVGREW